jgi:diguanylate cyclase (GGDEF)-like protein
VIANRTPARLARRPTIPDHEHLRSIYEFVVDGILIVDAHGVIVCANPAATKMFAGRMKVLEGQVFGFPIEDRNAVVIDLLTHTHGVRAAEMRVAAIEWRGEPAHLLSLRDVTEQTTLLAQLQRAANFDFVTGLPNRAQFTRYLEQAIRESRRHGGLIALLFIDLDDFKRINDEHGHGVGDAFLKLVGHRLAALLREEDSVARLAGDEFTVVLNRLEHPREAEVVATKIVESLAQPFDVDDHAIEAGVSIGIALFPHDAGEGGVLVRRADIAMYQAKQLGKGRYRFYAAGLDRGP